MLVQQVEWKRVWLGIVTAAWCVVGSVLACAQDLEWLPTVETHAWSRFGPRAWKEVRLTTYDYDTTGQVARSSTTIARTRVTTVGLRSYSLSVSSTVAAAGREFPAQPHTITRDIAPEIKAHQVLGEEMLTIRDRQYPIQVIQFVTANGTRQETNTVYWSREVQPHVLKRVTASMDVNHPESVSEITSTVTALDTRTDVLGELKCAWTITTVIKQRDKTITIHDVNCHDVPGELVSQVTEERDQHGTLTARKELEVVGYGFGRPRRGWRRQR
jgi:hypothetical protein